LAEEMMKEIFGIHGIPHVVHADRGTSMTSKSVAALLADLGVTRSHSRPSVSNDNPYSESLFKTMKYGPVFPNGSARSATPAPGAVIFGYLLGRDHAQEADWHTVTIDRADVVSDEGSGRLLTVTVDDWSYGMEVQVDKWIDQSGTVRDAGWPTCLEPEHPAAGLGAFPVGREASRVVAGRGLQNVPVHHGREVDRAMAQVPARIEQRHPGRQPERTSRVAEVVQPERAA
jgi:hypothetical protein